jgi:diguanylate cyclase (GGDEF)-like protein
MTLAIATSARTQERSGADEQERRRHVGRLGGALLCLGACAALPSLLLLERPAPVWAFALVAVAFVAGVVCLALPWERLPSAALHSIPITAIALVTAGVVGIEPRGPLYAYLYVLVVVMVAYSFRSRLAVAAYLALIAAGSAAPLLDPGTATSDTIRALVVSVPILAIAAAVVTRLRERLEAEGEALEALARRDPLTGIGNYRMLYERLDYEIARHARHQRSFAVMLLDLNRFKDVNEELGHLAGDSLLRDVGRALAQAVRDQDTIARQGGDEFSVLAPETTIVEVMALARRLQHALAGIHVGDRSMSASIGWAIYPGDGASAEALLVCADTALRAGKARWLPEPSTGFWPEHLRRLTESDSPRRFEAPGHEPGQAAAS